MRGSACQSCGSIGPKDLDTTARAPIAAKPITGTGNYTTGKQGWMFFYSVPGSGWTIKLGPANSIPIKDGSKFPVPPEGVLKVTAAGGGTPLMVIWPETVALALIADNAEASEAPATGTTTIGVEVDGTTQTYTPPSGTISTVVTLYDSGTTVAVGTDNTVPLNVGPDAQLSSWTHYGTGDIYFAGVNGEQIIFTNYTR